MALETIGPGGWPSVAGHGGGGPGPAAPGSGAKLLDEPGGDGPRVVDADPVLEPVRPSANPGIPKHVLDGELQRPRRDEAPGNAQAGPRPVGGGAGGASGRPGGPGGYWRNGGRAGGAAAGSRWRAPARRRGRARAGPAE